LLLHKCLQLEQCLLELRACGCDPTLPVYLGRLILAQLQGFGRPQNNLAATLIAERPPLSDQGIGTSDGGIIIFYSYFSYAWP
jgi:hypothetical protein